MTEEYSTSKSSKKEGCELFNALRLATRTRTEIGERETETEGEREHEALIELLGNSSDFCAYYKNEVRVRVRRERGCELKRGF